MSDFEIKQMTIEHLTDVQKIWNECLMNIEQEDSIENMNDFLAGPESIGYMAIRDKEIVGVALCSTDKRYGYIHHLAVKPKCQRQGIGKILVNQCKEFIFSISKVNTIVIFAWNNNSNGITFWNNNNFQKINGLDVFALTKHKKQLF